VADDADRAAEGRKFACNSCGFTVEHMYPEVALGILNNHKQIKHKES
jgi:hypothetical protein